MRKYNLTIVQKICFAGILIILVAIFQKIFAINYLPIAPFVRLSFGGAALIMFSSILLGPWFGLLIGAASDLIGYLIFDPKQMPPMFQITLIYAALGCASYFVFKLVNRIKNEKGVFIIEFSTFAVIALAITLIVTLCPSITMNGNTFTFNLASKIAIPISAFILLGLLSLFVILVNKHFVKKGFNVSIPKVSFSCFILEIAIMLIFGTLMKTWGFKMYATYTPFIYIFISQLIVSIINIPFNTVLISYIMVLSDKAIKQY